MFHILEYFYDPVLRAPMIASMLMCAAASLVGVIVFLKKESLLGEALSHATYPGVVLGVMVVGFLLGDEELPFITSIAILLGAGVTAILGTAAIKFLQKKKVHPDSSLCFVLAGFFGIGILLASDVQFRYSYLYKQIQAYFYGQAATMTDIHILIYGTLMVFVSTTIVFLQKEIKAVIFDERFAKTQGINAKFIHNILFFLIVLSIIIGIRSVGVVLMSGMLIAPAAAARQYTNRLSVMFWLACCFGLLSAFLGTYFSVEISKNLSIHYPKTKAALPSGPLIVLVATFICIFSLLFAKEKGYFYRHFRSLTFKYECLMENFLKTLWRNGVDKETSRKELRRFYSGNPLFFYFILHSLIKQGWMIKSSPQHYRLTKDGAVRAARITRLHRLWEVYLADYLEVGVEKVHKNADEMEHIITPQLEHELTVLLNDPKKDPHQQPIPPMETL